MGIEDSMTAAIAADGQGAGNAGEGQGGSGQDGTAASGQDGTAGTGDGHPAAGEGQGGSGQDGTAGSGEGEGQGTGSGEGEGDEGKGGAAPDADELKKQEAAVNRKAAELRVAEQKLADERQALESAKSDLEGKSAAELEKIKTDPQARRAFLEKHGITLQQLVADELGGEQESDSDKKVRQLQEELDALKKETADERKAREAREAKESEQQNAQAIEQVLGEIKAHIDKTDGLELCKVYGDDAAGLILEVQRAHFQNTFNAETGQGEIMPYGDAADRVEAYYEKQAELVLQAPKIRAKYGLPAPEGGEGQGQDDQAKAAGSGGNTTQAAPASASDDARGGRARSQGQQPGANTLTNQLQTGAPGTVPPEPRDAQGEFAIGEAIERAAAGKR